jgi:hypothetical protein
MTKRRDVLAGLATVAGGGLVAGTLPSAHAEATLPSSVGVLADARDETGDVGHIWLEVNNERPTGGDAIDPIVQCWAMERQTQLTWTPDNDDPIPAGKTRHLHLEAPGRRRIARLPAGNRAMARLWDRGTGASAHDTWEVGDP